MTSGFRPPEAARTHFSCFQPPSVQRSSPSKSFWRSSCRFSMPLERMDPGRRGLRTPTGPAHVCFPACHWKLERPGRAWSAGVPPRIRENSRIYGAQMYLDRGVCEATALQSLWDLPTAHGVPPAPPVYVTPRECPGWGPADSQPPVPKDR